MPYYIILSHIIPDYPINMPYCHILYYCILSYYLIKYPIIIYIYICTHPIKCLVQVDLPTISPASLGPGTLPIRFYRASARAPAASRSCFGPTCAAAARRTPRPRAGGTRPWPCKTGGIPWDGMEFSHGNIMAGWWLTYPSEK